MITDQRRVLFGQLAEEQKRLRNEVRKVHVRINVCSGITILRPLMFMPAKTEVERLQLMLRFCKSIFEVAETKEKNGDMVLELDHRSAQRLNADFLFLEQLLRPSGLD